MCSTFSGVLLVSGLPEHGSLWTDCWPPLKCLCHTFICSALITSFLKVFWIIQIVSVEECSSLMQNLIQIHHSTPSVILDARATQYTHTLNGVYHAHWRVQWSCHSLAARSHQCCANHSRYINNGWPFSRQTLYIDGYRHKDKLDVSIFVYINIYSP